MPVKTQAQLNYLKQDESLPGGGSVIYLSDTLLKLQSSSKLEKEKDFGIKGFKVIGELIKSRSNESGIKFEMVFQQEIGYNNILSNFNMLKNLKYLKGNGRAYYFEDAPNSKFTQKNFVEKYESDPELKEVFDTLVKNELSEFLSGKSMIQEDEESIELVENIKDNIWLGSDGNQYIYNEEEETITPVE